MCLTVDFEKTKNFSSKTKIFTFFKIFKFDKSKIYSLYYKQSIERNFLDFIRAEDELNINRLSFYDFIVLDFQKAHHIRIEGGCIHAYIERQFINKDENSFDGNIENLILPINVLFEDIISFGQQNDVCFFKYKIPKSSWKILDNRIKIDKEQL